MYFERCPVCYPEDELTEFSYTELCGVHQDDLREARQDADWVLDTTEWVLAKRAEGNPIKRASTEANESLVMEGTLTYDSAWDYGEWFMVDGWGITQQLLSHLFPNEEFPRPKKLQSYGRVRLTIEWLKEA